MTKAINPPLTIISEFGEELGSDRGCFAKALDRVFSNNNRCITGDIGLKIRLPDLFIYCQVCKQYKNYNVVDEHDIKNDIRYYCPVHPSEEVINTFLYPY